MNTSAVDIIKVLATPTVEALIQQLRELHGALLLHQSGGCSDGGSSWCYRTDDFILGDRDVQLGAIADAPFYMSPSQYEYWQHTQLITHVVEGHEGMFSLQNGEGLRFLMSALKTTTNKSHPTQN